MLRKLTRPIKYGVAIVAIILAFAIPFCGFSTVALATARILLWLTAAGAGALVLLVLAGGLLAWQSARAATRLSLDDPIFRAWLLEKLWLCREQGFLLREGSTLGECEQRMATRLRRDWGGMVSEVRQRPILLLVHDEDRLAPAPNTYSPEAAEEFVHALARISRSALVISKVQASPADEIRIEVKSEECTLEVIWPKEDDGRAIAQALSPWLPKERAFRSTTVSGKTYFADLSNAELARLERELGW